MILNTWQQVLRKEPREIVLLHGKGYGVLAGAPLCLPRLRSGKLASDLGLVESDRVHALGALRSR